MITTFKRLMASTLIVSMTWAGVPMSAHAGIVSTDAVVNPVSNEDARQQVQQFLDREDVQQALQAQGVSAEAAKMRVQSMTDAEVQQLAGRVSHAPAGGDVLGLLFTVFVILLVTDILGLTKVFPFTRSVR